MRKAAGFLLVLLLATLVVITTSSGDQSDSSHQVHLAATYGPQITCNTSCHVDPGMTTGGNFLDSNDLANTNVCDTCHSPDGAYDGVDDPNIGAKPNWATGVFTGGELTTGKEKWCVGCHDGVPSVINSVSAPNIAGEFNSDCTDVGVPYSCCTGVGTGCVDYGYYHTGHGKYVSESITCLACHDPDLDHVDSEARTYSAAADNYQAGYRLKSVGGQAPLVIPRLGTFSADQFRQCFSCHNSAPFMNFDNIDTNFRADVDDTLCVLLDRFTQSDNVNKHYYHLSIDTLEYDSDFDGVSADSPPSCPACHNVHGPRPRVGAVANAPGMIRTGELIGRYNEGALDLDYFINPCPDTTLSLTNETVGSTGGMMFEYSPTGIGSIARNGVCEMCHNEAQPYWRAAKKLPANDFSGDGNAVALWSVDNGALTADSSGNGNTLTDNNTVGTSTGDMQGGTASADFEKNNSESLTIADGSLASGFPLTSGASGDFSVTFWYKLESLSNYAALFSKWDTGADARSLLFRDNNGRLEFFIGHTDGAGFEVLDSSLTTSIGRWYHVAATFNNTTRAWQLRVYDASESGDPLGEGTGVVLNASGTAANNIAITSAALGIGASHNSGTAERFIDSRMDEIVVFRDILTTGEIDQIRQGTYAEVTPPTTTTTTLFPPTTTTTLPPPENDFSGDGNTVALWNVDNGALTADSSGNGNTLTDNNTVGTDTVDYQAGDAGADFEKNNSESLTIADGSLASGFPLTSGASGDFSVTFWYKLESLNNYAALFSKWDTGADARSLLFRDNNGRLEFFIGHTDGAGFEILDSSLTTSIGRWYHVAATFNNTTRVWQLRVYDASESGDPLGEGTGVVLNASGTAANNIAITSAALGIGASHNSGTAERFIDSRMDEIVVFRDILTTGEIDQIRQGTYAEVTPPTTTTTTLFPPTTTTTLPPPENDFSGDGNTVALWNVDNGALTADSSGNGNTLTDNNTVGTSTGDMQGGTASADFEKNNSESLTIADASLASGFPLTSGASGDFSVTFWYKLESLNNYAALFSKWDTGADARSLLFRDNNGRLEFFIGHTDGAGFEILDSSLTTSIGRWYHVAATFNNTTRVWQLRVYDASESGDPLGEGTGVVLNASGTAANNIAITSAALGIGASHNSGTAERFIDSRMDEIVVFRDILTTGEIDQIRQGTYAEVTPPTTTTTTLFPPTTTTTLPPPENDFSGDGNTVALWNVDNGALTADSSGNGNTLTDNNTVGTSTGDMQGGTASADFEKNNSESLTIADASLASGFPLTSGASGDFSVTFWYKLESLNNYAALFSKWDTGAGARSLLFRDNKGRLEFFIGHTDGAGFEILDSSLTTSIGRWYHVAATFNNTTRAWQLRVYDASESGDPLGEGTGVVLNASGTAANNIAITSAALGIGASHNSGTAERFIDSRMDEIVVFRDILTTGEIDQIRQGTYAEVTPPTTTTTTLFPPTTTTTLPPPENDFSGDGNTVALWNVDNGALTADSSGNGNTLTDNNTVGTDTVDYQAGDAGADFEKNNSESLTIADGSLASGFPLTSGASGDFSVTFWYKLESLNNYAALFSKWDTGAGARSLLFRDNKGRLEFFIGHTDGAGFEILDSSLTTSIGRWYHVAATFNNTTRAWQLRVYDASESGDPLGEGTGVVLNASGTAANNIAITSAALGIGASHNSGTAERFIDSRMDEIVVFRDILTIGEIDQVRQGTYAEVTPPTTTTTTLFPPTTTTTLPPPENDFSGDGNTVALWNVDNGALTADSSGNGNTLTDNNTVGTSTSDMQGGTASADFEISNSESLTIADANLASGFPLKDGESNGDFSVTFWFKLESLNSVASLFSKWDTGAGARSVLLRDNNGQLDFFIGTNSGAGYELLDSSLSTSTGRWYHLGATFNNMTKAWQLRVWDDTAGSVALDTSGTAANNIAITSGAIGIGASHNSGTPERFIDTRMDEIAVFDDILTTDEIDRIRQGTYADLCPTDPNKTEPGVCGCGEYEWGGVPDCIVNNSSHQVHLTDASGPQIASCDVCHGAATPPLFDDGDLTNTQVCDSCHSRFGAYDGVNDPNIGAKGNWVSGVYDTVSGGLLQGKEKWCVGCHDDVSSMINGVSAPNMAGDDIDYGYYKTGHGKHNNGQGISCLACHEPALMHVDGVARTYSAAADNYQAGYRLKLVDMGLPLDVPRSGPRSVEQFRLCFSCHDSAPYMNSLNTDTNFRADVTDPGVPLDPPENRHYYHLFTQQVWDSDWDGVPSDSAPSCTACHNVHGPKLKAGAFITHAPAMIRTGELIGRETEGALNLDYFINPNRDQTTSLTNELSGSTGGVFMDDPQQLENPQLRGGVCGMCHSTNEPYWRDANISIFSCDKCHTDVVEFTHFVELDLINDLSYSDGQPCSNCHDVADWSRIEGFEHNVSTNGDGSCLTCHQSTRPEVINTITQGSNSGLNPIHCLDCHSDKDHNDHMYDHATNGGTLGYAPITADAACTTCHSGDVVAAFHNDTCTTCHTATYPDLKSSNPQLDFNAGVQSSNCTTCHNDLNNAGFIPDFHGISWSHSETTTRHDNLQGSDSTGGYDCASCHNDMADAQAKLTKHMDHDGAGAGNNIAANCYRCHFPNTWGGLNDEPAQSVITDGKSAGNDLLQNCEDCHTGIGVYSRHGLRDDGGADDVSSVHENLMHENGGATSMCSNCHTTTTEQDRINLHTTTGSGSGDCLTCHQSTLDMDPGGPIVTPQDIIDAGKGPGGFTQFCYYCHISINTDWKNHTTVDHTTFVLGDANCTSCHDDNPGANATAPNAPIGNTPYVGPTEVHNPTDCYTCHDNSAVATRGTYLLLGDANVYGYVGAMPAGSTSPTCTNCHDSYFGVEGHKNHTDTGGHSVTFDGALDQTDAGSPCNNCHGVDGVDGGILVLDSWDEITALHDYAGCGTCHGYDGFTGEHNYTPSGTVANVILASDPATCASCHTEKITPNSHGGHDATAFSVGTDGCDDCHTVPAEGVVDMHNSSECLMCHTADGGGYGTARDASAGEMDTYNTNGIDANPDLAATGTDTYKTATCLTCHDSANAGVNAASMGGIHHDNKGNTTDCTTACHTVANHKGNHLDRVADAAADCTGCHTAVDIIGQTDGIPVDSGNVLVHDTCTDCHEFNTTPSTAMNSILITPDGTRGVTTMNDSTPLDTSNGGGNCTQCHTTGWQAMHSPATPVHSSLVTTTGAPDCDSCHENQLDGPETTTHLEDCSNCHNTSTGALVTTYGTDTQTFSTGGDCETCHGTAWDAIHTTTPDHSSLVTTTGTTDCASCHENQLDGPETTTHLEDCSNCHNTSTGALVTTLGTDTTTFSTGGDCETCHGTAWGTIHTTAPDHSSLVTTTGTGNCANCHENQLDGVPTTTHLDDCSNCHNTSTGALVTTLGTDTQTFSTGGDCETCHGTTWNAIHTPGPVHSSLVTTTGTNNCVSCHENQLVGPETTTHLQDCSNCHNAADGALVTTHGTNTQTFSTGGNCETCHTSGWETTHSSPTPDHNSLVTATGTVGAAGAGPCDGCHLNPPPLVNAVDPTVHNGCASCHNTNGSLVTTLGTDTTTFSTGGNCETCHVDRIRHGQNDHVIPGFVTLPLSGNCDGCHDASADDLKFVDPGDNLIHDTCSTCHTDPASEDWSLVAAASGGAGGGDCTGCHSDIDDGAGNLDLYAHDVDHADPTSNMVNLATACQPCHDTAVDYPLFVDAGDPVKHISCSSCHTSDQDLTLVTNATAGAGGGADCQDCHTGTWEAEHPVPTADHSSLVTVVATDCSGCHNNTLVSGAAETHNGCSSCHNTSTGALVTTLGTDTTTFSTGGDCTTCHGANWGTLHAPGPDHSNLVTTSGAPDCASCHENLHYGPQPTTHREDCSNCHNTSTGALFTTLGTDTQTFSTGGNCQTCHTGTWEAEHPEPTADHTSLVTVVGTAGCSLCHTDDTLVSGALDTHNGCSSCHNTNGSLVTTLGTDTQTFSTGGDCQTCHAGTWEAEHPEPTADHTSLVTVGATSCSTCHTDTPLVSGATETHNGCSSCHNTNGSLVTTLGTDTQTFSTGGDCTTCHGANWGTLHAPGPDHSNLVTTSGAPDCASCHENLHYGPQPTTHREDCSNCHNTSTGALFTTLGTDTQTFSTGGNCQTCHTGTWEAEHPEPTADHTSLVTVVGTAGCSLCHTDDPLVSGALDTHNGCSSCHNTNGSLVTTLGTDTQTFSTGGDCQTCHAGTWEAEHPEPTADHTSLVTVVATDCSGCHTDDPLVSGALDTHNGCSSCHNTNGSLVTTLGTDTQTFSTGGDCTTCHGANWGTLHAPGPDHSNLVTTSGAPDCASCHENLHYGPQPTTHREDCSNCHNTSTGALFTTLGTDTQTFSTGGNCQTCHTGTWEAEHPEPTADHTSLVTVVGTAGCSLCHTDDPLVSGALDTHNGCSSCHNTNGSLVTTLGTDTQTFSTGGNCQTCHTGTWEAEHTTTAYDHLDIVTVTGTEGTSAPAGPCGVCHSNPPPLVHNADATVHNACISCHDSTTGAMFGSGFGKSAPGNCETCHENKPAHGSVDHVATGYVTQAANCAGCHDATVGSGPPVGLGDNLRHDACTTCHTDPSGGDYSLVAAASGGTGGGGDCTVCHSDIDNGLGALDLYAHDVDHATANMVLNEAACDTCHATTTDYPLFVDPADPVKHSSCDSCHTSSTNLTLVTNATAGAGGGADCQTCHDAGTWEAEHPEPTADHTPLVTVGATGCSSCHSDFLLVDAGDAKVHNGCSSCHNAATGALVTTLGTDTQTFSTGGDCTTCHTGSWEAEHPEPTADHSSLVTVTGATGPAGTCDTCHSDALLVDNGDARVHNGCASCHNTNGSLVTTLGTDTTSFSTGGNCSTCHVNKESHGSIDHEALRYIEDSSTLPGCQSCHVGDASAGGVHEDCFNCHDTTSMPDLRTDVGSAPISTYVYDIPWEAVQPGHYGGTCEDCHNGHNIHEEPGVDVTQTPPQMCGACHGGPDKRFSDFSEIKEHHYNLCSTCHESTDPTVVAVINVTPGQYDGVPNPVNCTNCHNTVVDHLGHPLVKAGIRGSIYADDAVGQQTLTCFTAGCHASNMVEEHLSPRGIAYKNYDVKYGQPFTCELCHENKYPIDTLKRGTCIEDSQYDNNAKDCVANGHTWSGGKICSDPQYITQATCVVASPTWNRSVAECSDPQYTSQGESACINGTLTWDDIVINSDSIINTAIRNGMAGNYVYCSDCHQESIIRNDKGVCSDPAFENEVECINVCSIDPGTNTTQVDCLLAGGTWDVPSGNTWTADGYCNDIRFNTQSECEITGPAGYPVWYDATLACSDPQYETQGECELATTEPIWYDIYPYSIHDKYNGIGIYSFFDRHHEAEVWTGSCSPTTSFDEDECYQAGETWTPTFTQGNTFVGNGNCVACHKDPRVKPYDRSVCQDTSYAGDDAGCIGAGLAIYGGTCSDPQYLNTYDCTDNGGTWSGGTCLDYSKDQASCTGGSYSWITHPAGATKALPAPKQLPCQVCHADKDAAGDTLTIYKRTTGTQIDPFGTYGGWTRTPSGPIANTIGRGCADENPSYFDDEALCNAEPNHSWYAPLSVCFDETYEDRTSCPTVGYHWETPCSDNQYDDQATCQGYCSFTQHTDETACTTGGGTWEGGICLADQYISEPDCTGGGGTWTGSTNFDTWEGTEHQWSVDGYCSDLQYLTESACTGGGETWNGGNIQSYGACIFCHKMRPYHAYPGPPADDSDTGTVDQNIYDDGLVDPPHYPCEARGVLNVFYGKHRKPWKYYQSTGQSGNKAEYQVIRDFDALPDNSVTWWSDVIYDPQADATGMVPTADYCSDPALTDKASCESANQWWRPGHRMGEAEYFTIPTFDIPINNPVDAITIDTSNRGTEYDSGAQTILVLADVDASSTGVIYAIWAGVKKPMTIDSSSGGINTWTVTFTAADGVPNTGDTAIGRIYVINVDESGDNHDLLYQAYYDLHL